MLLKHNQNYDLSMVGRQVELCFGHGCSGHRKLLGLKRTNVLGMDALPVVNSWNTNGRMLLLEEILYRVVQFQTDLNMIFVMVHAPTLLRWHRHSR